MLKLTKIVVGLAVVAFALQVGNVQAEIEAVKAGSSSEFTVSKGVWSAFKGWWKEQQQRKVDWAQHPCSKDEIKEVDGEMGVICRSKNPASCTITVTEWEVIEGEGGPYRLPKKYTTVPPNCFGGAAPTDPGPQAP